MQEHILSNDASGDNFYPIFTDVSSLTQEEVLEEEIDKRIRGEIGVTSTYVSNEAMLYWKKKQKCYQVLHEDPHYQIYSELNARSMGEAKIAQCMELVCLFLTVTAAGYHHSLSGGIKNDFFDGSTPFEVNSNLSYLFQKIRSKLNKSGIRLKGFRVVEPHEDGTPHWHFVLFLEEGDVQKVIDVFRSVFSYLDNEGEVAGGAMRRVSAALISSKDVERVIRYLLKTFNPRHEFSQRVKAWSHLWGVRRYQFFGTHKVGVWREFRRLGVSVKNKKAEKLRLAADNGDWYEYSTLMGRIAASVYREPLKKCMKYKRTIGVVIDRYLLLTRKTAKINKQIWCFLHDFFVCIEDPLCSRYFVSNYNSSNKV